MKVRFLALAALAWAGSAAAEPTVADAAWLAGRWVGTGLGGQIEETWAPAVGGQMVGHFQLVKDGKPSFYEIMLLDSAPTGLRLRVKHFNPDFTAWEDKGDWHSFEPVSSAPGQLRFKGLSFDREGESLKITVSFRRKDGTDYQEPLLLRRAPL